MCCLEALIEADRSQLHFTCAAVQKLPGQNGCSDYFIMSLLQ